MGAALAENLSKIYTGGNKAANNISFRLEQGEIFGFLGPNGAGKTTTIKMLCGMLTPSSGSCRVVNGAACSYHCAAVYPGVCYGTGSGVSLSCGPFLNDSGYGIVCYGSKLLCGRKGKTYVGTLALFSAFIKGVVSIQNIGWIFSWYGGFIHFVCCHDAWIRN